MVETELEKRISPEELEYLKQLLQKQETAAAAAKTAALESRVAESETRNAILALYVKYGLKPTDTIDRSSGDIQRGENAEASASAEEAASPKKTRGRK